jgi:hypothetical protein
MIVAVTILSIIFITLIFCVSYLTAVLDVFKTALWYFAYEECKKGIESEVDDEDEDKK